MTDDKKQNNNPKRRRGRPSGASRLNDSDIAILRRVAELELDLPGAKFASLLKQVGVSEDTDIRRMRRKWYDLAQGLRDEALIKRDEAENRGHWGDFLQIIQMVSEWAGAALDTLPIEQLGRSIADTHDKAAALRRLGIGTEPPFDVTDPEKLASAVARFEMRALQDLDSLGKTFPKDATLADLPKSQHYYAQALMFYGLYEHALAEEDRKVTPNEGSDNE